MIEPLAVSAATCASCVGTGKGAVLSSLVASQCGLRPNDFGSDRLSTWIGRVQDLEARLPHRLISWDCRSNRLAWLGLCADDFHAAVATVSRRYGASRVAVIVGTSTSSIAATEEAYRQLDEHGAFPPHLRSGKVHTLHSLAEFVQRALGLEGPCVTVSTACSSGAKTFAMAERLLRLGLVDAAIVGGVDTLCGHTLFGFNALQLVSPDVCRPFDAHRSGISLGEAAGFALLQRQRDATETAVRLIGYGESSDAHHMSAPDPSGEGAERALDEALASAGVSADEIDYLHLHGTGTLKNDEVEGALVTRRFGDRTHASSTKGMTGHTLGAAGMLGAVFSMLALETGWMPGTVNCLTPDSSWGSRLLLQPLRKNVRLAMANSFGFGGSNCVLVFGRS